MGNHVGKRDQSAEKLKVRCFARSFVNRWEQDIGDAS